MLTCNMILILQLALLCGAAAHEMTQSFTLPHAAAAMLAAHSKTTKSHLHLRRGAVGDGKHYALFLMEDILYVNNTYNVSWSYEVPHEKQMQGTEESGAVVQWHSMDITPLTEKEHPKPYAESGLGLLDLKPLMKKAGIATTPRRGDSNLPGSWKSKEMRQLVADAISSGTLKDKFGQPVEFEGCSGPDTGVMITDATYRTTEQLDFDSKEAHNKIFHVGWAHIDRWEYSAAHVMEWELQWAIDAPDTNILTGCDGKGGEVRGRTMCGELIQADTIMASQGNATGRPIQIAPKECYDTQMHNLWLSLGTRKGLDDPMGPMKARHFAVQTPHHEFDKCDLDKAAPMMAGTCRSLLAKYGPWVKEGKWWYKPDTEFGEALAFRGQEGSPHATLSSQADEPHRESVDMRIVCVKKRDSCPILRKLSPRGRMLPQRPIDRMSDTMCLPRQKQED